MHCISLAILSRLSQFPSPQLTRIDLSVLTSINLIGSGEGFGKEIDAFRKGYHFIVGLHLHELRINCCIVYYVITSAHISAGF